MHRNHHTERPTMFKLEITMGNDAMQTPYDVAEALRDVLLPLDNGGTYGTVRDANGNVVGGWTLSED
jgi:hypothetical protein